MTRIIAVYLILFTAVTAAAAGPLPTTEDLFDRADALHIPTVPESAVGCFARDVVIPDGKVWRAVLDVYCMTEVFINGVKVEDKGPILPRPVRHTWMPRNLYNSGPVDIRPYLKPGRNRVCLRSDRAFAWIRGSVVMSDGTRVQVDTTPEWRWIADPTQDWTDPDKDISGCPLITGKPKRKSPVPYAAPVTGHRWFYRRHAGDQPAYDGLMTLHNPEDNKLFFRADAPVRLHVKVPIGLRVRKPLMDWSIERYVDGETATVHEGAAEAYLFRKASLLYELNAGTLPPGVYLLCATLRAGEETIEVRPPEPFVVLQTLAMNEVQGDTYTQGMDVRLEQTIDFTKPDDSRYPWMETDASGKFPMRSTGWTEEYHDPVTDPIVVERNGLRYRETRPHRWAQFSYKVSFEHPGDWYVMVLEYPDDRERWMGVSCSTSMRMRDPKDKAADGTAKCGPAIWAGGKYPSSGEMREMRWLYRPDPGFHAINLITLGRNMPAAASRLKMYHVRDSLPALHVNPPQGKQRLLGLLSERTVPYAGFSLTFSVLKEPHRTQRAGPDVVPALAGAKALALHKDTCEAYTRYLRFTGQNLHVMGAYQYHDANTAIEPAWDSSRLDFDLRDTAARVFDLNGIAFLASVEFINTTRLEQMAIDDRERTGEDWNPYCLVTRNGEQPSGARGTGADVSWNFVHPEVEAEMLAVVDEIARKFKGCSSFLGVNWTAFFGGGWIPSFRTGGAPLDAGYGDTTVEVFEDDTGIRVPGDERGPERFRKRYEFLTAPDMRPVWVQWRCAKMRDFFAKAVSVLKAQRVDLECSAGCYLAHRHITEWLKSGKQAADFLSGWGWDRKLFAENPALWLTPWMPAAARYQPAAKTDGYAYAWQGNVEPTLYGAFNLGRHRSVMLNKGWVEVERVTALMPQRPNWPRPYQSTMQVQQAGDFARAPYVQAMIGLDPNMVMFGFTDLGLYIGQEQRLRSFARVLRALPRDSFERYNDTGFRTNLAIRQLKQQGKLVFYVVNPGYWPVQGEIALQGIKRAANVLTPRRTSAEGAGPARSASLKLALPPYGIAAFVAEGPAPSITGWTTEPLDQRQLEHMRSIVRDAEQLAAMEGAEDVLGAESYVGLVDRLKLAKLDLDQNRPARAWSTLTDAEFWTTVYQRGDYIRYADLLKKRRWDLPSTTTTPVLDGTLDDVAWTFCEPLSRFVTADRVPAEPETFVYGCHDGENLYFAFECRDESPADASRGTKEREVITRGVDFVDFFIRPDPEGLEYFQMAVNVGGGKFDQRCYGDSGRQYGFAPAWTVKGGVTKDSWVVEVKIPASSLNASLQPGDVWGINFYRQVRDGKAPHSAWSYNPGGWHDLEWLGHMTMGR